MANLISQAEAISTVAKQTLPKGKQTLPKDQKVDWTSALGNIGIQATQNAVNTGAANYMAQVQEIEDLQLGEDETFKRMDALSAENKYLAYMSPMVWQQQKALKRKMDPAYRAMAQKGAEDRAKEALAINDLSTIYQKSETLDQFNNKLNELRTNTEGTLKTGASAAFNKTFNAVQEYGNTALPTMFDFRRGQVNNIETINESIFQGTNVFLNKIGKRSPTVQELSEHIDKFMQGIVIPGGGRGLKQLRKETNRILREAGDLKLAQETFQKYPNFFTTTDMTKNIPNAIKQRQDIILQNPQELTAVDKEVLANNEVGKGSFVESGLITNNEVRFNKEFLDDKMVHLLSPEAITQLMVTDSEYALHSPFLQQIQNKFKKDFEAGPGAALIARGVITAKSWAPLQGISYDDKGVPDIDWNVMYQSLRIRAKNVSFYKNNLYKGTNAIQNVFETAEKDVIRSVLGRLPYDKRWEAARKILSAIEESNNQLSPGQQPINALFNLQQLIQSDTTLINMIGLYQGLPMESRAVYEKLSASEALNAQSVQRLRGAAVSGLSKAMGLTVIDSTVTMAVTDYMAGKYIIKNGGIPDDIKSTEVTTYISDFQLGNSHVVMQKGQAKDLRMTLAGKTINWNGKPANLYNLIKEGKVALVNAPYSLNVFTINTFRDDTDALSNIGAVYINPDTKRQFQIEIPAAEWK